MKIGIKVHHFCLSLLIYALSVYMHFCSIDSYRFLLYRFLCIPSLSHFHNLLQVANLKTVHIYSQ